LRHNRPIAKFRRYRKLPFYFFLTELIVPALGAYIYYQFSQAANETNQTNYKIYQQAPLINPCHYPFK
jgi:hypothetical protein